MGNLNKKREGKSLIISPPGPVITEQQRIQSMRCKATPRAWQIANRSLTGIVLISWSIRICWFLSAFISSCWVGARYVLKSRTFPKITSTQAESKFIKPLTSLMFGKWDAAGSVLCIKKRLVGVRKHTRFKNLLFDQPHVIEKNHMP